MADHAHQWRGKNPYCWICGKTRAETKLTDYMIILTERGKEIFKGGNKEVMQTTLRFKCSAKNKSKAEGMFHGWLLSHGGSSQKDYYEVKEA